MTPGFWENSETVARFAARDADLRLLDLAAGYVHPPAVRVLDLGCAGGRNTVFLAAAGFQVWAVDSSEAMVRATRDRLAPLTPPVDGEDRVRQRTMDDLTGFQDGFFDLVVALGVYHNAESPREWNRALAETRRVLARGGRLLIANFTPRTDPTGEGVEPVPGMPHVYRGFPSGLTYLLEGPDLDASLAAHGMFPHTPTVTVERATEKGRRVTANAFYVRP